MNEGTYEEEKEGRGGEYILAFFIFHNRVSSLKRQDVSAQRWRKKEEEMENEKREREREISDLLMFGGRMIPAFIKVNHIAPSTACQ